MHVACWPTSAPGLAHVCAGTRPRLRRDRPLRALLAEVRAAKEVQSAVKDRGHDAAQEAAQLRSTIEEARPHTDVVGGAVGHARWSAPSCVQVRVELARAEAEARRLAFENDQARSKRARACVSANVHECVDARKRVCTAHGPGALVDGGA